MPLSTTVLAVLDAPFKVRMPLASACSVPAPVTAPVIASVLPVASIRPEFDGASFTVPNPSSTPPAAMVSDPA